MYDCLCGLAKAKQLQFFDFDSFDPEEYEYFEQVRKVASLLPTLFHWHFLLINVMLIFPLRWRMAT